MASTSSLTETDLDLLRRAIALAALAREHGNHPFGALLADPDGNILVEAENTVTTEHDITGHAETNLVRKAYRALPADVLATATLYTSTEPCAMCAGAIYWVGISRVVYGLAETELARLAGADEKNPTLDLPARIVLGSGQRPIAVLGPLLVAEAAAVHAGFWNPDPADQAGE